MSQEEEDFREKLESAHTFPGTYIFKFIVKKERSEEVERLVEGADVSLKPSSGNKYVSVTIHANVETSDEVLEVYRKARKIEGLIAL